MKRTWYATLALTGFIALSLQNPSIADDDFRCDDGGDGTVCSCVGFDECEELSRYCRENSANFVEDVRENPAQARTATCTWK